MAGSDAKLLLAEDDAELRSLLAEVLEAEGYEVTVAKTGRELFDRTSDTLVSNHPLGFDVLVSDVRMPGWSGLEVLRSLRQWDTRTPVILITAFPEPELVASAHELGATVVAKPFELEELVQEIRRVLAKSRRPGTRRFKVGAA